MHVVLVVLIVLVTWQEAGLTSAAVGEVGEASALRQGPGRGSCEVRRGCGGQGRGLGHLRLVAAISIFFGIFQK